MGGENERLTQEQQEIVRMRKRGLLNAMIGYCRTTTCLHAYMTRYFADPRGMANEGGRGGAPGMEGGAADVAATSATSATADATASATPATSPADGQPSVGASGCGNCSNCLRTFTAVDVTDIARAISRCVHDLHQGFGSGKVVAVLRGSKAQELTSRHLDRCPSYGVLEAVSQATIRDVLNQMATDGFLAIREGRLPVVGFGPRAMQTAQPDFRYEMKRVASRADGANAGGVGRGTGAAFGSVGGDGEAPDDENKALFERLREVRRAIAQELGKPPYIVFSDRTLRDMTRVRPVNDEQFLAVNGVGERKLERYGQRFMDAVRAF
jgi:ATP-dependent DNA helicase RecQ